MKDTMLAQYRAELDRRLDRLLSGVSQSTLLRRRDRYDLFHFVTRHDVPYTNNAL
jgi:transposase